MTKIEILQLIDKKNKQIIELSYKIRKETKNLPSIHATGRINNYIQNINVLYVEMQTLENIIV